jgi:hypothetical protein
VIPKGEQWNEIAALSGGDLSVTSYAVLVAAMARSGRSGVLRMARQPIQKQIFIAEGRPVECRSNLAHETFGRFLRSEKQISESDYESALSESLDRRIPLGEVLIERGLFSPHEIYKNLQKSLARKLLDGFTWESGDFEVAYYSGAVDTTVKVNTRQLILTGVLKLTPQSEIDSGVGRFRHEQLTLDPHPIAEETPLRLSRQAQRIVQALSEHPATLEDLASTLSIAGEELNRVVYSLALVGRVLPESEAIDSQRILQATVSHAPDPPQPGQQTVSRAAAESSDAPQSTVAGDSVAGDSVVGSPVDEQAVLLRRASIVEAYLSFNRKDSFDFLELEEGATDPDIDRAYLRAAETYAPWSLRAMGASDFTEQGEVLFLKAAQAYAELRNSESRGALIHRRKVLRDEEAGRKKPKFSIKTDLLDSEEQFKRGLSLVEGGQLGKALELLEFAVDCDSQNATYRAELAYRRAQFDSHRYQKQSIRDLREAIRIDARCGLAYFYLGLVLAEVDGQAGAEEALRRSIKLMAPDRRPIEALKKLSGRKKR